MTPRSYSRSVLFACLVAAVAFPRVATAAPPAGDPQDAATPENLQYRKAFAAIDKEDWAEARRLLLPLWDKFHTWDIASSLGQVESMLNNHALGARYVSFAIANLPPKENIKVKKRLQKALAEMKAVVGTARVAVNKDAADVLVDGELRGTSPLPAEIYLEPGSRLLEARLHDGASAKQTLQVVAGGTYEIALVIEKPSPEMAPFVLAPTQTVPTVGAPAISPPIGSPESQPGEVTASLTPNWTPVLITGGLALVAMAVGTGFAVDANSAKSNAASDLARAYSAFGNNPCYPQNGGASKECQDLHTEQDRRDSSTKGATISFLAGGALAAFAVGSYFWWPSPKASQTRVSGWGDRRAGGLSVQGSF